MSTNEYANGSGSNGTKSNSNPRGINQHKSCPAKDDPKVAELLREYQRRNITSKKTIKGLLLAEHGVGMSENTVTRRRRELGLKASARTTREMPESEKRQLLMDQLAKAPSRQRGPRSIKEAIALESSVHLTRDWITEEMRRLDPAGFALRHPHNRKENAAALEPQGPHHSWMGCGYEKLARIGFPVWCLRDSWTISWLGMWVLPHRSNKLAHAYRYLSLVKSLEGMPMQGTALDGKEVTLAYSLTHALREALTSEPAGTEPTADRFVRRMESVMPERGSAHLQFDWGDSMLATWEQGNDIYNPDDPNHYELVQWLWSTLIQRELDNSRYTLNNHKSRKDRAKSRPTGITPSIAMALYAQHGGVNCLQAVDVEVVGHLADDIGGEDVVRFVSKTYERRVNVVFEALGVRELKMTNVWDVFSQMLPLM